MLLCGCQVFGSQCFIDLRKGVGGDCCGILRDGLTLGCRVLLCALQEGLQALTLLAHLGQFLIVYGNVATSLYRPQLALDYDALPIGQPGKLGSDPGNGGAVVVGKARRLAIRGHGCL